jgi:predicted SAM-dependent methyltransferase
MKLDIACGTHKQGPDWTGMDIQKIPGVDIVHDVNVHPWPLDDECVEQAVAWHIIEHIPPVAIMPSEMGTWFPFIEFMNECWRVLKPGAEIDIECPHGASDGYRHDPTHCNQVTEVTWEYFDYRYERYLIYRPRPWRVKKLHFTRGGNVSVILEKIP